jgi:hypothetical protein
MAAIFTVYNALVACGVDNVALFLNETPATRLAEDIFDDLFETCKDLTFKELDDHFKTYSELTVQQGQIRVCPGVRKNIKACTTYQHKFLGISHWCSWSPVLPKRQEFLGSNPAWCTGFFTWKDQNPTWPQPPTVGPGINLYWIKVVLPLAHGCQESQRNVIYWLNLP